MRPRTFSGSPKKNAARLGSSKYRGGSSVGLVPTCQTAKTAASNSSCQSRRSLLLFLLLITLEHFRLHRAPNLRVQLEIARHETDLGHVAGPRQIDLVFADRSRC